jgi:hypothetical protein
MLVRKEIFTPCHNSPSHLISPVSWHMLGTVHAFVLHIGWWQAHRTGWETAAGLLLQSWPCPQLDEWPQTNRLSVWTIVSSSVKWWPGYLLLLKFYDWKPVSLELINKCIPRDFISGSPAFPCAWAGEEPWPKRQAPPALLSPFMVELKHFSGRKPERIHWTVPRDKKRRQYKLLDTINKRTESSLGTNKEQQWFREITVLPGICRVLPGEAHKASPPLCVMGSHETCTLVMSITPQPEMGSWVLCEFYLWTSVFLTVKWDSSVFTLGLLEVNNTCKVRKLKVFSTY